MSITNLVLSFGKYYDSTNINQNGVAIITTENVENGVFVDIELNGVTYSDDINNNKTYITIPYYVYPTLTTNIEYLVTATINGSAHKYTTFIYNPTINETTSTIPNNPTVYWPSGFTSNKYVSVIKGSGASYWEYSIDGGLTWNSGGYNSFTLSDGTYPPSTIRVRNVSSSGIRSLSELNTEEIIIHTVKPDPPSVLWPDELTNDGTVTINLASNAIIWQYSINNGISWNYSSGSSFILNEGSYDINSIQVRNSDVAGNISEPIKNPNAITIDTTFPGDPIVTWPNNISKDGTVNVLLGSDATSWEYTLNNGTDWIIGNGNSFILQDGTYDKYILQVRNSDDAGNISYSDVNEYIITIDNVAPVIILDGSLTIIHEKGLPFVDPGYSATDFSGVGISSNIIVTSNLNINIVGNYQINYNVSDDVNNHAIEVIRNVNVVDTVAPVITLNGDIIMNHEKDTHYIEPGYSATDLSNIDLTENVITTNNIDIRNIGTYQVTYDVSDNAGNFATQVVRTVNVVDTTAPVITLIGNSFITHEKDTSYNDAGAIAFDFSGIDLTSFIITNNDVDVQTIGNYTVTYDVSDNANNQAVQVVRTVNVVDTIAPIINIIGDSVITHEKGTVYNDPGAIATDFSNIDLTSSIITTNNVDINTIGSYSVTYDVSDNAGNEAAQVVRTVNVVDTIPPIITLIGNSIVNHEKGNVYNDLGARATDFSGIDLTSSIITNNNVDINTIGSYSVTFDVSDNAGNEAVQVVRTVNVIDTIPPIITLIGNSIVNHEKGNVYNDPGAIATDFFGENLTSKILSYNNILINLLGTYQVSYDVSDNAGNFATQVIRTVNVVDTIAPVITLIGDVSMNHEKGTVYNDAGAIATDFSNIDLTSSIITNNNVDVHNVGSYSVTYDVSDNAGNQAVQVVRTVNVIDTTIPIIILNGDSVITHEKGTTYNDAGATAMDFSGIDLTSNIITDNKVNINIVGSYTVSYDVSDNAGNQAIQGIRTVNVVDTIAPVITLIGDVSMNVEKDTSYNDAGSTATDFSGIDLTSFIITVNNVDIHNVGSYSVTYDVNDNAGNQAVQVVRTVNVVDTTAPVITLIGDVSMNHEKGTIYNDAGSTATDLSGIDLTSFIITVNNVDIHNVGSYNVTYDVSDNANNQAVQVVRTVNVVDTTAPIITLIGDVSMNHEKGTVYNDPGAIATDLSGIDLTSFIITVNNVDIHNVGSYNVTYDVSDNANNQAVQVVRTVNVVDTTAPVITLIGDVSMNVEKDTSYNDAGATAMDLSGVDLTSFIITVNNVDIHNVGSYSVTYDVSDNANNQAVQVVRTVNVVDTTAPIITLIGESSISHQLSTIYNDPGATAMDFSGIDLTSSITVNNNVDVNVEGTYSVIFNVVDACNNAATTVIRTVNVIDKTPPMPPIILWPSSDSTNGNVGIILDNSNDTWEYSINGGSSWNFGSGNTFTLQDGTYEIGQLQVRSRNDKNIVSSVVSNTEEIIIDLNVDIPIVTWPNSPANNGKVVVNISSEAISWEYSVDRGNSWIDGSSNYFVLVDGLYNVGDILVRNTDAVGSISANVGNPYEIIIDSIVDAPFVTWPTSPSNNGVVTVLMSSEGVTWEYRLNSSSDWIDGCGNTFILPEGTYPECTIQVRNSDASGNVSAITINPLEIIVDYEPPNDNSGNNVDFTLSGLNGSLTTSQFDTSNLNIEDMAKYVHVMNVDMSRNKWNDIFYISPQGPAYLDTLSELADENTFLNETIKFMTMPSNFTDTIDKIAENNLILETGTLTNDIGLYNISESCIKIWSKAIFGGIEFMDDVWSNRNTVKYEINNFLSTDTGGSFIDKLRMVINNANGTTNENTSRMNLTRQLMLQLHNKIYGTPASYRLTDVSNGIFTQSPVDISGNPWTSGDKYYPFKFIKGDTLNFGLTLKHPDVYISVLGNSFDSNSPPNVNIKVRITMV